MFDLNASVVRRSLAETILWCSRLPLTAVAQESDEMCRRRRLIEEAGRIYTEHTQSEAGFVVTFVKVGIGGMG
jgi:hypothetical protein